MNFPNLHTPNARTRPFEHPVRRMNHRQLAETVEFLASHAGGGSALEFAIGTGRVAIPLSERGIHVDGIELSTDMIAQLRKNAVVTGWT